MTVRQNVAAERRVAAAAAAALRVHVVVHVGRVVLLESNRIEPNRIESNRIKIRLLIEASRLKSNSTDSSQTS